MNIKNARLTVGLQWGKWQHVWAWPGDGQTAWQGRSTGWYGNSSKHLRNLQGEMVWEGGETVLDSTSSLHSAWGLHLQLEPGVSVQADRYWGSTVCYAFWKALVQGKKNPAPLFQDLCPNKTTVVVKNIDSMARCVWVESCLCPLLGVWPWANCLFLIYKMRIIIIIGTTYSDYGKLVCIECSELCLAHSKHLFLHVFAVIC